MLIDRYIYAVTKELPKKSRPETARVLRVLIDEKIEEMNDSLTEEEKVDRVLRELGDPKFLADTYRGHERYLIGPRYYDKYIFVLKIVAVSIVIGLSVATGAAALFGDDTDATIIGIITSYIGNVFSGILQGAAWVTAIFALLEYNQVPLEETGQEGWDPSQLPELPEKKAHISRGESIFSIMFSTIILTLFFFLPEVIGISFMEGSEWNFIPLFNLETLTSFKFIIFIIFTINILIELVKIIKGRWTLNVALITTALSLISATLFITVIYNMNIWSPEIIRSFERYLPISFERMLFFLTGLVILVTIGEVASALYKGLKYGSGDQL